MAKQKKSTTVYKQTSKKNANIKLSIKEIEKLPDISPADGIVPANERIIIATFEEPDYMVPESDYTLLAHEMNDSLDVDPVKFKNATSRNQLEINLVMLEELSKDKDPNIRAAIGRNCFISGKILHQLAQDQEKYVRESVSCNDYGNLEERTMKLLAKDKDEFVRLALSYNKNLPLDLMKKMMKKERSDLFVVCSLIERQVENSKNTILDAK